MKIWKTFPRMTAWLVFFGGLGVVLAVDHYMRIESGWALHGGLPEIVYYGVPALLSLVSVFLLWRATSTYKKPALRIVELVAHLVAGSAVYLFALLLYVTETGIDSL